MNTATEEQYAEQLGTQMRKGLLVYCALVLCSKGGPYNTSEIIRKLQGTSLDVVGGTIYPLLNRLCKDGLLSHEWHESSQGPPRKYYQMSDKGRSVLRHLERITSQLQKTINDIERDRHA
jgi:PadR family transcriptional regulator, regulatory protein PadR